MKINTGCKFHKLRLLIMENTTENGMPLEEVLAKRRAMELAQNIHENCRLIKAERLDL